MHELMTCNVVPRFKIVCGWGWGWFHGLLHHSMHPSSLTLCIAGSMMMFASEVSI